MSSGVQKKQNKQLVYKWKKRRERADGEQREGEME